MKKTPFRLTPYQVQFLLVVGFLTVGYAMYLRYLGIEFSSFALACDAGLQTVQCKARALATSLFRNSVFGIVALIVATLHVIRPSIVLADGWTGRRHARHRALQHRAVGDRDRPAYFRLCTARARHSVSANNRYIAQVHNDCQLSAAFVEAGIDGRHDEQPGKYRLRRSDARPPAGG